MKQTNRKLNESQRNVYLSVFAFLFVAYILTILSFSFLQDLSETMYWTPDSVTYKAVGNWIFGIEDTNSTLVRPFFYPLFLNLSRSFAGNYGIWFFQFVFWICSGMLIYRIIEKITNKAVLSFGAVLIYSTNFTLIGLTLNALSEVTVVLLITILIDLIVHKNEYKNNNYWPKIVFVVSLLAVTKPVFILLLYIVLIYRLPFLILAKKKWKYKIKPLCYIIIALFPVFAQFTIMAVKHDEFAISKISSTTFERYFFSKVYGEVNDIEVIEPGEYVGSFTKKEMHEYVIIHYKESTRTFFRLIKDNIKSASYYVNKPVPHPYLSYFMKIINQIYYYLHISMILPTAICLILLLMKRRWSDLEMVLSIITPMYIIIFTSGITFGQGDRVVLPSLTLWIALYSLVLSTLWILQSDRRVSN